MTRRSLSESHARNGTHLKPSLHTEERVLSGMKREIGRKCKIKKSRAGRETIGSEDTDKGRV